ncbi:MAG: glycine zipper domain-containing protein [Desulforhopalus sp.]
MKLSRSSGSLRTLKIALVALILIGFSVTQVKAQNRTVNGVIIGAAVGGVVGLIVGSEMHKKSYSREHVYNKPVYHHPPPPPKRYYDNRGHSKKHSRYKHSSYNYRSVEKCRDIVVISERRGHYRKSVKTVCRDRKR